MDTFEIAGNTWVQIGGFVFAALLGFLIGKIVALVLARTAARFESDKRQTAAITCRAIGRAVTIVAFGGGLFLGFHLLELGEIRNTLFKAAEIVITLGIVFGVYHLVEIPARLLASWADKTESKLDDMMVSVVAKTLRVTVVVLGVVQIAQILSGAEITSIIAGLGIGGLAVALAAQDTVKNFFGSIVILYDKPFELGDRIIFDSHDGTVEDVGIRSIRLRRLDGHLVTIPNGELSVRAIHNVARRPFIRRLFNITVTYDTPPEKMVEAKAILEDILKDHEGMNPEFPPRVYFSDFNDASLGLLVIYWYHPPAFWDYLQFSERVNLEILRRFNAAGIDFAFPTQTLHLAGDKKRPLDVGIYQLHGCNTDS